MSLKKWRKSASLLLVAKNAISSTSYYNYKLLTLKRSSRSSSNPEATVFPGGIFENHSDASQDWLKVFNNFGFQLENFLKCNATNIRPPIFKTETLDEIPRCLSLRITAIRETFEESGVLICRNSDTRSNENLWSSYVKLDDISTWQKKIHREPREFLNLCSQLKVYPDVTSLHDWSNWHTPPSVKAKFDTVFFLSAFHEIPPTLAEQHEVMQLQWSSPQEYDEQRAKKEIHMLVPQFYEISRLRNFREINSLVSFAQNRACEGLEQILPYKVSSGKQACMILPGDESYPLNYDRNNEEEIKLDKLPETNVRHRVHIFSPTDMNIEVQNYKPLFNHILPLTS